MSRLEPLEEMLKNDPADPLLHYMLANEYFNAGRYSDCVAVMEEYLTRTEDEGAAYRTLAQALLSPTPLHLRCHQRLRSLDALDPPNLADYQTGEGGQGLGFYLDNRIPPAKDQDDILHSGNHTDMGNRL